MIKDYTLGGVFVNSASHAGVEKHSLVGPKWEELS
jgi:hypothetical protein